MTENDYVHAVIAHVDMHPLPAVGLLLLYPPLRFIYHSLLCDYNYSFFFFFFLRLSMIRLRPQSALGLPFWLMDVYAAALLTSSRSPLMAFSLVIRRFGVGCGLCMELEVLCP